MAGQLIELERFFRRNAALGQTERERDATLAELYYLSKQHEDKKEWHDKSVPLRSRKPRIIVPLPRKMVEQVDRFIWSGTRAPRVVVGATRDAKADQNEAVDVGPVLDDEQAEALTSFVARMVKAGRLLHAAREFTTKALITTSAAVVVQVRSGFLSCYVHGGKDCTPTFREDNQRAVGTLEIKYKFPRDVKVMGTEKRVWYWYRRVITEDRDITYHEVEVDPRREPEWVEDPTRTVEHRLGFCPVVWVRTFPDCDDPIDGKPFIDPTLYPMFDAISYAVSQKQRSVEYGADPQPYRKGVPEADRAALAKTPGQVWDLPGDSPQNKVAVGFLEVQGSGAKSAGEHIKEMHELLRELVGVVDSNPEIHARNVTGIALQLMYAPMIALASDLRCDLGDDSYAALIGMALRLICAVTARGEDVWIPGVKKAAATLTAAQLRGAWLDPPISLEWPAFFQESEDDKAKRVDATVSAQVAGLITRRTAVRTLAPIFTIDDPAAELEQLEEEAAEAVDYGPLAGKKPGQDSAEEPDGDGEDDPPELDE